MSYDKYTWQTGETITAEKLNHIEDGIVENNEKNELIISIPFNKSGEINYDWNTIVEAVHQGRCIIRAFIDDNIINEYFIYPCQGQFNSPSDNIEFNTILRRFQWDEEELITTYELCNIMLFKDSIQNVVKYSQESVQLQTI